ncbi:MAG: hypothetical protein JWQ28_2801, partial [Pedobacter sp.]|nr:hypothetical protein [Pedobacter sp.]
MTFLFLAFIIAAIIVLTFIAFRFKAFSSSKPILAAVAIAGLFNLLLFIIFNKQGILTFQHEYLSNVNVSGIPVEPILLSFVLPYALLVIYMALNVAFPFVKADKYSLSISNMIMGLSIAMIFFAYDKGLAIITFSLLLLTLFYVEYKSRLRFMLHFYRAYAAALIVFLLIFIPENQLSIYNYTAAQTIELKLAYIPFESYFTFLWISLVAIFSFEYF